MKYANLYKLEPADRIVEPLFQTGLSTHHAIYLGIDRYGQELIAENHKQKGVQIIPARDYFSSARKIDRIGKFSGSMSERNLAIKRALGLSGKPYDLLSYNCEHYANEVQNGAAESKQVRNVFVLFILFIICLYLKYSN